MIRLEPISCKARHRAILADTVRFEPVRLLGLERVLNA